MNNNYDPEKVDLLLKKIGKKLEGFEEIMDTATPYFDQKSFDKLPQEKKLALLRKAERDAGITDSPYDELKYSNKLNDAARGSRSRIASLKKMLF